MDQRELFKHYMLAGHGRAFSLIVGNEELFRDIVLYGCLNDISYDMQCEGSRGMFVYNLALQYDDHDFFLNKAIEKFMTDKINGDWHTVGHICDFIDLLACDNNDVPAKNAIEEKYARLYELIMTKRISLEMMRILQSYEYLAITIIQNHDLDRTLEILRDMGAYFIRRRRKKSEELKGMFLWFWHKLNEEYGSEFISAQLEEKSKLSKELKRFKGVMLYEETISGNSDGEQPNKSEKPKEYKPTAEEIIELVNNEKIKIYKYKLAYRRAEEHEKIKYAKAVLNEADLNKKAKMLGVFTSQENAFPLDFNVLVEYTKAKNKKLRHAAFKALIYTKTACVHDFALKILNEDRSEYHDYALEILLNDYHEEYKECIFMQLDKLSIDQTNSSGWHDIILTILNAERRDELPDELFSFIYLRSLCSCCRENAFREMKKRNMLTDKIISESLWDCNDDIRAEAEKQKLN